MGFELKSKPEWLQELFPWKQHSVIIKGAGHFTQEDAGEEVAGKIVDWMTSK